MPGTMPIVEKFLSQTREYMEVPLWHVISYDVKEPELDITTK